MEIEIRNSIVQEFAKKHLKSQVISEFKKVTEESIKRAVSQEFLNGYANINPRDYQPVAFNARFMEALRAKIKEMLPVLLNSQIREVLEETKINETLEAKLKEAAELITYKLSDDLFKYRINEMVDSEIKKRLNLK